MERTDMYMVKSTKLSAQLQTICHPHWAKPIVLAPEWDKASAAGREVCYPMRTTIPLTQCLVTMATWGVGQDQQISATTRPAPTPLSISEPRSASLSSDDIMGLSRSQLTLSRSSTLPYDQTPQRAQPQRGGGVKAKARSSSPGSQMVTLEEFLQESNVQSPPMVSTGSREDLMTDYFTRSPAPSAPSNRDQVTPTSYVMPTVQTSSQRPGQSVKPSPRQPVGQSPSSGQRSGQSLSRAFSLASADLLRSSGPDSFRANETGPGQSDVVVRRQGGGANVRERPLSARLAGPNTQLGDSSFLNPPIHHSSSLNLPTERYTERERERERGRASGSRNGPPSSSSYHHRGEVAMVNPVRAVPATRPNDASEHAEVSREGQSGDSSHLKKEGERERSGSVERPKSTPASPDPNNDPQTVWYEYGCV